MRGYEVPVVLVPFPLIERLRASLAELDSLASARPVWPAPSGPRYDSSFESDAEVFQRVLANELDKAQQERREARWADMRASDREWWGLCEAVRRQSPPLPPLWCDEPAGHAGDHHWCVA